MTMIPPVLLLGLVSPDEGSMMLRDRKPSSKAGPFFTQHSEMVYQYPGPFHGAAVVSGEAKVHKSPTKQT